MKMSIRPLASLFVVSLALAACNRSEPPAMSKEPLARNDVASQPAPAAPAPKAERKAAETTPASAEKPSEASKSASAEAPKSAHESSADKSDDTPKSTAAASDLEIKRLVVTHAIEHREPAETSTFSAGDEPVYAFVEIANKSSDPGEVFVTFERQGSKSVGHVRLEVPGKNKRWRTWGRTRFIREPGTWNAVVRTKDGQELAKKSFEVTG